jgi:hypothetical protein
MKQQDKPFWQTVALTEMTPQQWESLCDGCGKCCLFKIEDEDSGEVYVCNVACRLLDLQTCQCKDYPNRKQWVPDCTVLTPDRIGEFHWLPSTCAYRLIAEGKPLPDWHPLVTGEADSTRRAGQSVCGLVISEDEADALHLHVTDWQF